MRGTRISPGRLCRTSNTKGMHNVWSGKMREFSICVSQRFWVGGGPPPPPPCLSHPPPPSSYLQSSKLTTPPPAKILGRVHHPPPSLKDKGRGKIVIMYFLRFISHNISSSSYIITCHLIHYHHIIKNHFSPKCSERDIITAYNKNHHFSSTSSIIINTK